MEIINQRRLQNNSNQTIHPKVIELLARRGLNENQMKDFFSWDLKQLPDLTNIKDIDKSAKRIIQAIENKEKIAIYGDYDVDGTTSCALLYFFFKYFGIEVDLIQPSRFIEGYGIHPPAVEKASSQGVKLLITVDCGITNSQAADRANELGVDLIITDHHHDALPEMPKAFAIVNPNRRDESQDSELKYLAGVGVAFALAIQVKKIWDRTHTPIKSLYELLPFVAIGTVCDLAKLTPMNLKLVRHGLKQIPSTPYCGLKAFFTPEELRSPISSEKLSFHIGPLINSKGRLDHPEKSLKLLIARDPQIAYEHFSHLDVCNNERKFIQNEVFFEAKKQVLSFLNAKTVCLIVYEPHWHEGVIGIVASKLVEEFKMPAIVFCNSETEGVIKASARAAGEMNLFEVLNSQKNLFIKFGGHKAAAGLSMIKENLELFKRNMHVEIQKIPYIMRTKIQSSDLDIEFSDINPNLLQSLNQLEPFGMGNPKPLFRTKKAYIKSFDLLKEKHVRWSFSSTNSLATFKGISFNWVNKWNTMPAEDAYKSSQVESSIDIYYTLGINRFNGNEYIQLMVEDIQSSLN
ncbi:MAG: single-stranded-DNA-specific exonuclease RecJ [Halobacteriovoraceae bacterium]|nr:single-stranded-DNA-specific exonuclease RecJ [Halobacteriovoraceae bacterium]